MAVPKYKSIARERPQKADTLEAEPATISACPQCKQMKLSQPRL